MMTLILGFLAIATAVLLSIMGLKLRHSILRFKIKKTYTAALEAPSVSVCIPARNENHAMTECLERVLASDYRKLEIIVFDDSSADDTSVLIRSFAHAGVRFVPGANLPEGWLGKNRALEVLAREASGTYVMFMDVDTQIESTTISQLVGYTTTEDAVMTSVIPQRNDTGRASVLFGHLRYMWQLVLDRPKAPATASSLWLIRRSVLLNIFGGFKTFRDQVEPEAYIAARLGAKAYRCLVSTRVLGVTYEKKWHSQMETSHRLLYPVVGGRPGSAILAAITLLLLNMPTFVVLSGFLYGWSEVQLGAGVLMIYSMAIYATYLFHIWRRGWWAGMVLWPVVILQELLSFVASVVGYGTGNVTWKGRHVATPGRINAVVIDE